SVPSFGGRSDRAAAAAQTAWRHRAPGAPLLVGARARDAFARPPGRTLGGVRVARQRARAEKRGRAPAGRGGAGARGRRGRESRDRDGAGGSPGGDFGGFALAAAVLGGAPAGAGGAAESLRGARARRPRRQRGASRRRARDRPALLPHLEERQAQAL